MRIVNDSNMWDWYIETLKKNYKFDQVFFKSNTPQFIFFECLSEGVTIEIRYNISEKRFELHHNNRWIDIFIEDEKQASDQ
jgi:hypothetical protein